ncbi:MAG: fumarylacetoacetate hydrolase family protein [Bacteroidota bacterium]
MKTIPLLNTTEQFPVSKIFCIGKNYLAHAKEMGGNVPDSPVIFLKPVTALNTENNDIIIPSISKMVHHEVEFVLVIGKDGKNIPEKNAAEYIFGYAVGLDMTLRDIQTSAKKAGLPWTLAKGFDTSAPISPIILKEMCDETSFEICCRVNNDERQHTLTSKMIFSPEQIISYISKYFTLEKGDLIFTGTPEGVSEVHNQDIIEAELVGFTSIRHQVIFQ